MDYPCFRIRNGLENCRARILAHNAADIAFLGRCAGEIDGWAREVEELLAKRFPAATLRYTHAFGDRCGVLEAAARVGRLLAPSPVPTLAFLDFTAEDPPGNVTSRCMERVVRALREADRSMDIVVIHGGDQSVLRAVLHGKASPHIDTLEAVSEHYGLPSVNFARYAIERRAIDLFDWLAYCPDGEANTPLARALHVRAIEAFLAVAWADPAYPGGVLREHPLPPPLYVPVD